MTQKSNYYMLQAVAEMMTVGSPDDDVAFVRSSIVLTNNVHILGSVYIENDILLVHTPVRVELLPDHETGGIKFQYNLLNAFSDDKIHRINMDHILSCSPMSSAAESQYDDLLNKIQASMQSPEEEDDQDKQDEFDFNDYSDKPDKPSGPTFH